MANNTRFQILLLLFTVIPIVFPAAAGDLLFEIQIQNGSYNTISFTLDIEQTVDIEKQADAFFQSLNKIDSTVSSKLCHNFSALMCMSEWGILEDIEQRLAQVELEQVRKELGTLTRFVDLQAPCFHAENGSHFCAPNVLVAGAPKCGTTALYFMLASHSSFKDGFIKRLVSKESCPCFIPNKIRPYARIKLGVTRSHGGHCSPVHWLSKMPISNTTNRNFLTVNGCLLDPMQYAPLLQALNTQTKFIVMVRNYADWAYSAFNFWCRPEFDGDCLAHGRYVNENHYRSPALFEEIVRAKAQNKSLKGWPEIGWNLNIFRSRIEYLQKIFGEGRVAVIQSEKLRQHPRLVLQEVSKFLDIPLEGFGNRFLEEEVYINPASYPGVITDQHYRFENVREGSYHSAGYMTLHARQTLDLLWKSECLWLGSNFEIKYSGCYDDNPSKIITLDANNNDQLEKITHETNLNSQFV